MASRKSFQPVVDARGRLLLERRGVPTSIGAALGKDAYHLLRTTWTRITLLFGALFLVVTIVFAAILYLGRAEVMNAHGFLDDFWFSVQTLATIGYGYLAPADTLCQRGGHRRELHRYRAHRDDHRRFSSPGSPRRTPR